MEILHSTDSSIIPLSFLLPPEIQLHRMCRLSQSSSTIQRKSSELCIIIRSAGRQSIHTARHFYLCVDCHLFTIFRASDTTHKQLLCVFAFFTLSDRKICWLLPWWKWFCVWCQAVVCILADVARFFLFFSSSEGVHMFIVCHWNWKFSGGHYLDCMQSKYTHYTHETI